MCGASSCAVGRAGADAVGGAGADTMDGVEVHVRFINRVSDLHTCILSDLSCSTCLVYQVVARYVLAQLCTCILHVHVPVNFY